MDSTSNVISIQLTELRYSSDIKCTNLKKRNATSP